MYPDKFIKITQNSINELVLASLKGGEQALLLNNCCEPINPDATLKFFLNACSIIVDRIPETFIYLLLGIKIDKLG